MNGVTENFKINLNQNLWGLVVSFLSLGIAEHYKLCTLFWFATVIALVMSISIILTTYFYTKNYCKNKSN